MQCNGRDVTMTPPAVTAIIQTRMGSTRLPGKALLPLAGLPLTAHVIERTMRIAGVGQTVIATTTGAEDRPLMELAREMGCAAFAGSVHDVLERYYLAWREFGGDIIVRVTGDNPFTDVAYNSQAVAFAIETGADLCSVAGIPLGTAVEIFTADALARAYEESTEPHQREHVSPFIKEHPERFRIARKRISIDNPYPDLRLTIDTPEDFELARSLYEALYRDGPFPLEAVITEIARRPELAALNAGITQRAMTHSEHGTR